MDALYVNINLLALYEFLDINKPLNMLQLYQVGRVKAVSGRVSLDVMRRQTELETQGL